MIYFICGHRGCGKSYLANQIKKEEDCILYDTGPIIRNQHKNSNPNISFSEWIDENKKVFGKNFTNMVICRNITIDDQSNTIIIGNRTMEGIEFIINYFNIDDYKVVYIDGDYELFRNNYNDRESKKISSEEYMDIIDMENKMGIERIKQFSKTDTERGLYFYKKENNDEIYKELIKDIRKNSNNKAKVKVMRMVNNEGFVYA